MAETISERSPGSQFGGATTRNQYTNPLVDVQLAVDSSDAAVAAMNAALAAQALAEAAQTEAELAAATATLYIALGWKYFRTQAELTASTDITYNVGLPGTVAVGDHIGVGYEIFQVVTAGAATPDITTVNGVKLDLVTDLIYLREGTTVEYLTKVGGVGITPERAFEAADTVVLAYAANVAIDLNTFFNARINLTGNVILDFPTNLHAGQKGTIWLYFTTGGHTVSFGSGTGEYVFNEGITPAVISSVGSLSGLDYEVLTDGNVWIGLKGDVK